MRNNYLRIFSILLFFFISGSASAFQFNKVYVFGDSLSDQGNLASINPDVNQPPLNGRFTNGQVSVELLAEDLGVELAPSLHLIGGPEAGTNYAVAGAKILSVEPIDLSFQVAAFLTNNNGQADVDSLYVIFAGGNDIRFARDQVDSLYEGRQLMREAADEVIRQIDVLHSAGAKHFLVLNAPDLSIIPETRRLALDDLSVFEKTKKLSKQFNLSLKKSVFKAAFFEYDDVNIGFFNVRAAFNRIIKKLQTQGDINTTDACLLSVDCDFSRFVFFDEIHPTELVHEVIGQQLIFAVDFYHGLWFDEYDMESVTH